MTGHRSSLLMAASPLIVAVVSLIVPSLARGETFDLYVRAYCPATSNKCGFSTDEAFKNRIYDAVQEINLLWRSTGISFRPYIPKIVEGSPYETITACCPGSTCSGQVESDLRLDWQQNVAAKNPLAITLFIVDKWGGPCCSGVPALSSTPNTEGAYGIFCDARAEPRVLGSLLAHEVGHHFCLCHTYRMDESDGTLQDTADYDASENQPLNWDYDSQAKCGTGETGNQGIGDTAPDPGRFEVWPKDSNGVPYATASGRDESKTGVFVDGHEWCDRILDHPADAGSPHAEYCTLNCYRQTAGNPVPWFPATMPGLAMGTMGADCRGPYVIGGIPVEAFSTDQVKRITACRNTVTQRQKLPDVCKYLGGDTDHDGRCDQTDNCKLKMNTSQADDDDDGLGNACDLSPVDPFPAVDIDLDHLGNLIDQDQDGDGCSNAVDQHFDKAQIVVGSHFTGPCGFGTEPTYAYEGNDSDGDGVRDCQDLDDDNDGLCDSGGPFGAGSPGVPGGGCAADPSGSDPCPLQAGLLCHLQEIDAPCPPEWLICPGGGCFDFFAKIVPVGDPDPGAGVVFDTFQIVNRSFFFPPLPGRTLSESGLVFRGIFPAAGGLPGGATSTDLLRLEIWSRAENRPVAVVAEYVADTVDLGDLSRGEFLVVTPQIDALGQTFLAVAPTFALGVRPGDPPLSDSDRDGIPDTRDNCLLAPNAMQTDADGDRFGNACDADLDEDLIVSAVDVQTIESCDGADLRLEDGMTDDQPDILPPPPAALALARSCAAADLNEDKVVDADDAFIASRLEGLAPGPSLMAPPPSRCSPTLICEDENPCTVDRCSPATGQCYHVPLSCDDGDGCTLDACDPLTGVCGHSLVQCGDGDPCTIDSCNPADGTCRYETAADGTVCDDGSACTVRDACLMGVCTGTPAVVCNDGNACTIDTCNPATMQCEFATNPCDDGNPCSLDDCDSRLGSCVHHFAVLGTACDDGNACTLGETCDVDGQCTASTAIDCNDGDPCTVDACNPATGQCGHAPLSCDDGDACTVDTCGQGSRMCRSTPLIPGESAPVRFINTITLAWSSPPPGSHSNTYRGTVPASLLGSRAAAYDHLCFESADFMDDGAERSVDYESPPAGSAFYYLITQESVCGEGSPGQDSAGTPRPNAYPCLTPP